MIQPMQWTARRFTFDLPVGWYPAILARLRGTPARAEFLTRGLDEDVLSTRPVGRWSAKEHIAHLDDLEELDRRRLEGFLSGASVMAAADMSNRKTEEAGHNSFKMAEILKRFARNRGDFVERLESLGQDMVEVRAFHPRLEQDMRLLDWAYFIAEHDDHHLAHAWAAVVSVDSAQSSSPGQ